MTRCDTLFLLPVAVEKDASSSSDAENTNMWIVIGVVIPLLVVVVITSILYWKLCRTDKLEFQPDAMASIQQRQKVESDRCVVLLIFWTVYQKHYCGLRGKVQAADVTAEKMRARLNPDETAD